MLNTAVPTAAPISRKKLFALVAVPSSCGSTAFCTASTIVCMTRPRPAPRTKTMSEYCSIEMSAVMVVIHTSVAVAMPMPAIE